jgi:hypothetical protein
MKDAFMEKGYQMTSLYWSWWWWKWVMILERPPSENYVQPSVFKNIIQKILVWLVVIAISWVVLHLHVAHTQTPTPAPASVQFQPFAIGSPSPVPLLPSATASAKDDAKATHDLVTIGVTPAAPTKRNQ